MTLRVEQGSRARRTATRCCRPDCSGNCAVTGLRIAQSSGCFRVRAIRSCQCCPRVRIAFTGAPRVAPASPKWAASTRCATRLPRTCSKPAPIVHTIRAPARAWQLKHHGALLPPRAEAFVRSQLTARSAHATRSPAPVARRARASASSGCGTGEGRTRRHLDPAWCRVSSHAPSGYGAVPCHARD